MRALLLRRTAFLAILVTGVSEMDRELQLAAVSQERPTFVDDHRGPDCDGWHDEPSRRV
jgi:hypothetical protein